MVNGSRCLVLVVLLLSTACAVADDAVPPGIIRFRATMVSLGESAGQFRRWRVTHATIDEAHPERSRVDAEIDLASVDTSLEERDRHLRGDRFLDIEQYPTATVTITDATFEDPDHVRVTATLDLHGVVRAFPMTFAITDRGARRIAAEVTLKRLDFGIGPALGWYNPMQIRDEVIVDIDAVVPAPAPSPGGH
ncbi:MAG TPA: YceI family protein [Candidatus Eisenbacteria bacterium]|nr:YceI family protein [Candidatus Eisenbacteria bacterium]